ncbi:histone-lysine N-methyltransferase 2D isoform X2 [Hoplias malabaricus]|uniref:histone-lysine N-methyltransferase 2D isoform X2 n=1 Tax=Hoplias malabaricus TaxID=27720 RepID=UPI003461978C
MMDLAEIGSPPAEAFRCKLCDISDEDEITGPLSAKEGVHAHQNCLLYSSGIYCRESPSYDDLFGFDVEDVKKEIRRGAKLKCSFCKKRGATVGCELPSCHRSYHYPCAVKDNSRTVEKQSKGTYMLFCPKHDRKPAKVSSNSDSNSSKRKENSGGGTSSERGQSRNRAVRRSSRAGLNKANSSQMLSQSDADIPVRFPGRKRKSEVAFSDDEIPQIDLTNELIESDMEDNPPPKQHKHSTPVPEDKRTLDHSAHSAMESDEAEPEAADSAEPLPNGDGDDTDIEKDSNESQSLLQPEYHQEMVSFTVILDSGPSLESDPATTPVDCNSNRSPPSPEHVPDAISLQKISPAPSLSSVHSHPLGDVSAEPEELPTCSSLTVPPCDEADPYKQISRQSSQDPPLLNMADEPTTTLTEQPLDLTALPECSTKSPSPPENLQELNVSETAAVLFWRRCNEVGCTEAIFTELTQQLSTLAERVQSQQATQQENVISLKILEASGKLPVIFKQLEQDFDEREQELRRKKEALREARAVLNHLS